MAINVSVNAKALLSKRTLEPNLILEIDGVSDIYSALEVISLDYLGDSDLYLGDPGHYLGGVNKDIKPYISLGTSGNNISQQLLQDKGGTQSITTFSVDLLDKNNEITKLITPGLVLDDILGVKARVFINYNGGSHPEDSILVHKGVISGIQSQPASIKLTIDAPERSKHQDIFVNQNTKLNGSIDASVTTITVDSTEFFLLPSDSGTINSYFQIEDEIIKYTGTTSTTFTGCTRGALGTTAAAHDDDTELSSVYELSGNAIDLALKLMLSQGDSPFATENPLNFVTIGPSLTRTGAIFFDYYNIQEKLGLVVGDLITTTGASNPANNLTDEPITAFGTNAYGSWIEVAASVVVEDDTTAEITFKSKYDVLSEGLGMSPIDVDVERHELLKTRFNANIPNYTFYLKDTVTANDFLNAQIYYPAGFYSLPRKTKASIGITTPPIADQGLVFLDETNVVSPSGLSSTRSTNKNFYNSVIYKYEKDVVNEKYLSGKVNYSASSQTRIKNKGNNPITIISDGLRDDAGTDVILKTNSRRLLDRYQFAAESYQGVKLFGKTGVTIEVGDIVSFGGDELNLSNTKNGTRNSPSNLFEVVNKSLNVKTQEVTVDLLSTNFSLDGRYGIIGPSSYVDSGSTTTNIRIAPSFSTAVTGSEKNKYLNYIGQPIKVHSPDWTYNEESILIGFDPSDDFVMILSPALPSAPSSGYIVDAPTYDFTNSESGDRWKLINCFFDPQVEVVSGSDNFTFDVDPGDVAKFTIGLSVRVHNFDYTVDFETKVAGISGTTITVDDDMGFVPSSSEYVDLIGFPDGGSPYRLI